MSIENYKNNETKDITQETQNIANTEESQDKQTIQYFEKIAKEPGTGTFTGLVSMRDFGMKTVDSELLKIESNPNFEKSGNQNQIFEAYEQVQNQFDNELNAIHSQNLSPEEYGKAMKDSLKRFEKNLESAAKTANGLLHGTLAEKSEKDAKELEKNPKSSEKGLTFQEKLQKHIQENEVARRLKVSQANEMTRSQEQSSAGPKLDEHTAILFPGNQNISGHSTVPANGFSTIG